jgi:hypothetical protein
VPIAFGDHLRRSRRLQPEIAQFIVEELPLQPPLLKPSEFHESLGGLLMIG